MTDSQQNNKIIKLMFLFEKKIHKLMRDSTVDHPLSQAEMMALGMIHGNPGATVSSLSAFSGVRKSSISNMIHKLQEKGLVQFTADREDKRMIRISLTKKALLVLNDMKEIMSKHSNELLSSLTKEEKTSFIMILEKIVT